MCKASERELGPYLKESQVDQLPQQVSSAGGLQVARQATQLLEELHQIIPMLCLQAQPGVVFKSALSRLSLC